MTKTIAHTHEEVAEIKSETVARGKFEEPTSNAATDIVVAAERLQDLAWTMREHGLDMTTCEQIETLASTILSASSLRDPADRRAQKLGEALRYLERRIDSMIESTAERAKVPSGEIPAPPLGSSQELLHDDDRCDVAVASATQSATASSEAPPADAAGEPEPADFLLEPLPIPLRDRAPAESETVAAPPTPPPSAAIGLSGESMPAPTIASTLQHPSDSPSWSPAKPMPRPTPSDPLAALNTLSDDERIALFT
jgi:hypothetical protein